MPKNRFLSFVRLALCVVLAFPATLSLAFGQQSDQSADKPESEESVKTFKVGVDVVQLFFNVKDKKGALIPSLTKEEFEVTEDGKPQTIKYFTAESNLPLTLGMLIDTSGSQQRVLDMEKEVGGAFLTEVLHDKDMAFVLSFDVDVELLQDFTGSTRTLKQALNRARINTGGGVASNIPGIGQGPVPTANHPRGTALYDAVYLASHDELAKEVGRKAMVLLTDGQDFGSRVRIQEAIEAAQKADSICYVLLVADLSAYSGMGLGYSGDSDMKKLAKETGGRVIEVGNKRDKLKEAFDQIANELRSQYNVGFTSTNTARDGAFRKVEVRSKGGYKIQSRAGYFARSADAE